MGGQGHYTKITPLPQNVPRLLALDLLHSHDEFIKLNPLVIAVKPIDAPRNAAADEYFSNWYEITEQLKLGPGWNKKLAFKGCFHSQPWGLQTHILLPAGIEMRNKYRVGGNQPGEPRETRELGVNTPEDGLYLREDISYTYSIPMMGGYVKKGMQEASAVMIERMRRKAELLDEGRLVAMFEDGKLKTTRPTAAATFDSERPLPSPGSAPGSPQPMSTPQFESRDLKSPGFTKYHNLVGRNESVRSSAYIPSYQQGGYNGPQYHHSGVELPASYPSNDQQQGQQGFVSELPGSYYQQPNNNLYPQPLKPQGQSFRAELAGDNNLAPPQASQDHKPAPPNATHPAYQQGSSPQPSPRLPPPTNSGAPSPRLPASNGHPSPNPSQRSNSGYQIANPDQQQERPASYQQQERPNSYQPQERPASYHRQSSNNSNSVQQWQQSVANDTPIDDNYYRNSRHSHTNAPPEPDHQRFSSLAIGQQPLQQPQQQQQYAGTDDDRTSLPSQSAKCPVCGLFEGDEKAVSHHVSKAHFQ